MDNIIKKHLEKFIEKNNWDELSFTVTLNKNKINGDYASNICFLYAKKYKINPEEIANDLILFLKNNYYDFYEKIEFAKPGFINFFLKNKLDFNLVNKIIKESYAFPIYKSNNKRINIEFVSANPTGKLHLAHTYAAIFGNTLVNVWKQLGYEVQKEFYINDAGNQIDKLALSVLIRYLNLLGKDFELYEDAYHGEEIKDCAKVLYDEYGNKFIDTRFNENGIYDKDINEFIKLFAKEYMLKMIKEDLAKVDVSFDLWTSEKQLYATGDVKRVIDDLNQLNQTYQKDDALWLKSSNYGDDKDRVLIKNDGAFTYLVPDIALHVNKLMRNFDEYYNIWGMDHHGYIPRLKIALKMLNYTKTFEVISIQVMKLIKDNKEFKLSKRAGTSLTLQDLIESIGKDELKWICTSFQTSTHKVVDVNKITKHDNSNPLFYVEYASARISSILQKNEFTPIENYAYEIIDEQSVIEIVEQLNQYEHVLVQISRFKETQALNNYLYKLAGLIHEFYNTWNITNEKNEKVKLTLLHIIYAAWIILHNGLSLIGINAYKEM